MHHFPAVLSGSFSHTHEVLWIYLVSFTTAPSFFSQVDSWLRQESIAGEHLRRPIASLPISIQHPLSKDWLGSSQSWGPLKKASASVLPKNTQDWSPSGWTGWISVQSKGLSRVFSSTIVQKHQFFSAQLSSQSNSHIHTWPLEKP